MKDINLFKTKNSLFLKKVTRKEEVNPNDSCDGFFICSSEREARRIIDSLKGTKKIIAFQGGPENRRALETLRINYLISPEKNQPKDTLKQRNSGLNHVLAKIASKKNIKIVISLAEIRNSTNKPETLSKIMQNIKVCQKAKCEIKIANLSTSQKDLLSEKTRQAIGIFLGMNTQQAKNSIQF